MGEESHTLLHAVHDKMHKDNYHMKHIVTICCVLFSTFSAIYVVRVIIFIYFLFMMVYSGDDSKSSCNHLSL